MMGLLHKTPLLTIWGPGLAGPPSLLSPGA